MLHALFLYSFQLWSDHCMSHSFHFHFHLSMRYGYTKHPQFIFGYLRKSHVAISIGYTKGQNSEYYPCYVQRFAMGQTYFLYRIVLVIYTTMETAPSHPSLVRHTGRALTNNQHPSFLMSFSSVETIVVKVNILYHKSPYSCSGKHCIVVLYAR